MSFRLFSPVDLLYVFVDAVDVVHDKLNCLRAVCFFLVPVLCHTHMHKKRRTKTLDVNYTNKLSRYKRPKYDLLIMVC